MNINLLLTEREGRTGEYWPEVVAVRTECSEVRTETTEGQYSPVRLELARLVSSLLYGTRAMLVLNLPAFESKKYAASDRFHGNGPYGKIPTEKGPIRTLGFTLPYNNNLLLTEREGHTGEYWPEVVAVWTERSEVRTKTTEGQCSPVYGIRAMLVLSLPAFENKKYTAYDRFHGNGPYGEIPTKKEPIRTLGFALPYNNC